MAPSPAGTAACIERPRAFTARTASGKVSVRAATCADHSPSECPAARAGVIPCSASTRQTATLTVRMAGWVFSVRRSSSSGPSRKMRLRGNPRASSASANVVAATGKASARERPMPTVCEPWPGNRKAIFFVVIPFQILLEWEGRADWQRLPTGFTLECNSGEACCQPET